MCTFCTHFIKLLRRSPVSCLFVLLLFLHQLLPFFIQFILVEAGVVQIIAFFLKQHMILQYFRVVDLILQFHNVGTQLLDFILDGFQAGAQFRSAAARASARPVSWPSKETMECI